MADEAFKGNGYSRDPLTPEELARHRNMFEELKSNFIQISDDDLKTLATITPVRKAWPLLVLVFSATITAVKQGYF